MKHRLSTSVIALSAAMAAPAVADVTAADVWENQQAFFAGFGASLSGDLNGDQLVTPEMNIILPEGIASMQMTTDATVTLADNGDGTVTITYPSPMGFTVSGGVDGEGSFSASMTMTHDGYTVVASGNPDDITYAYEAQNMRLEADEISFDGAEEMTFEGFFALTEWSGTSQITIGNLINYTAESFYGDSEADFVFAIDDITSSTKQTALPMETTVTAALQVGGSDVMNLSAATRDGLRVTIESSTEGNESVSSTTLNGDILNSQSTQVGPQTALINFDENGLVMTADADGFAMTMNEPLLFPGDLDITMGAMSMDYDVPLNASDEPQDFRIATSISDITLGDTIWDMFDPAGQLPRDPAEISFDVTGMGTNGTDLLDIMALSQMFGPPAIEVDEVTIENLRIAAVGAELMAEGAMTFDWTDMQTIPGIARPEGQVTVNLNGANALMDTLAQMGLIPEEELMMPRMMMGMFATPVGDDMLESVLEVNEQGHVLANGQRLQ